MGKGAAWKGDGGGGRVLSQDSDKTKGIFPQNRFSSKINRYTSPLVGVWVYLPWSAWLLGRGIEKTGGEGGGVAGGGVLRLGYEAYWMARHTLSGVPLHLLSQLVAQVMYVRESVYVLVCA
jgi:hypothetical protein